MQYFNHSTGTTLHQSPREQASKGYSTNLTDLRSICLFGTELRAGISGPWLQSPW